MAPGCPFPDPSALRNSHLETILDLAIIAKPCSEPTLYEDATISHTTPFGLPFPTIVEHHQTISRCAATQVRSTMCSPSHAFSIRISTPIFYSRTRAPEQRVQHRQQHHIGMHSTERDHRSNVVPTSITPSGPCCFPVRHTSPSVDSKAGARIFDASKVFATSILCRPDPLNTGSASHCLVFEPPLRPHITSAASQSLLRKLKSCASRNGQLNTHFSCIIPQAHCTAERYAQLKRSYMPYLYGAKDWRGHQWLFLMALSNIKRITISTGTPMHPSWRPHLNSPQSTVSQQRGRPRLD